MNDNLFDIAKSIYNFPIRKPKTYNFQLEDSETYEIAEKQGFEEYIQGMLSIITLHGVEILYNHRNFNKLTESELDTVKSYTRSYGYNLIQIHNENYLDWKFEKI